MNINLLTFEPWREDKMNGNNYLIRFEHLLEKDDDTEYSKPVTFNLQDVFRSFDIAWIKETTLAGNQWLLEAQRFKFQPDPKNIRYDSINQKFDYRINPYKQEDCENQIEQKFRKGKDEKTYVEPIIDPRSYGLDYEITLNPMQIRTFVMQLNPDNYDH